MSELPSTWIYVALSEMSSIQMGQSPDSSSYNTTGDGLPFFQGKTEFGKLFPTTRKWCSEPKKIAELNDILLSVRAPVGPTNLAIERCCVGRGLAAIQSYAPNNQKYLLYYFRNIEGWLSKQGTGTTFSAISGDFIRGLQVPIAPLNEQKRIADKLDRLLAKVDNCRERLDQIPLIIKRFRQSVLTVATSGKLTEDWRANHSCSEYLWQSVFLNETCLSITDGDHQAPPIVEKDGIPFITISAINTGKLEIGKATRFVPYSYFEDLKDIRKPKIGDILFSVTGSIAIPAMVESCEPFTFQRHIAILKPDQSKILDKFLFYSLGTENIKKQSLAVATGTAQLTIPLSGLRKFTIDLPSINEQKEIVRQIEKLFAFADRLEARYQTARAQIDKLTPALLDKAFKGELVPQDPTDEPAATLLAKIQPISAKPKANRKSKAN
jgi:type I restriction enzyme, S subunit